MKSAFVLTLLIVLSAPPAFARQQNPPWPPAQPAAMDVATAAGSQPDHPGPLAGLSPRLKRRDILKAMRKVADWQLQEAEGKYNIDWTYAVLYDGFLAATEATGDRRYRERVFAVAQQNHWDLGPRIGHADDEAIGLAYLAFYARKHDPAMLAPTRKGMDKVLARPDNPDRNLWWWCDAFYMAPPVLAQLTAATGDPRYLRFMDHEWSVTTAALYDPAEHLYYRDKRYLSVHEPNGKKVFWSRGNGWVLAGLAQVIQRLPPHSQLRPEYIAIFRSMAARIAALQPVDGLWRASLLDPGAYPAPEVSGTALFAYAMAWGINQHILEPKKFIPVVSRAWQGMIARVYASGRLGSIQPIEAKPGQFKPSSSYVYGVGAFLMAGSELSQMVSR